MNMKRPCAFLAPDNRRRGTVLLLVLWALFFLALLSGAIAAYVRPALELSARQARGARLRFAAESGVRQLVSDVITRVQPDAPAYFLPGTLPVYSTGKADISLDYTLVDEERKINLNYSSCEVLGTLFSLRLGDPLLAADLADAIVFWREGGSCPRENRPRRAPCSGQADCYHKGSLFEFPQEINFVEGMTPAVFAGIKDVVTVYGSGAVNINTADQLVLRALGINSALAETIVRYRNGPDGQPASPDDNIFSDTADIAGKLFLYARLSDEESDQLERLAAARAVCVRSSVFTGHLLARDRKDDRTVDFVFTRDGQFKLWREE